MLGSSYRVGLTEALSELGGGESPDYTAMVEDDLRGDGIHVCVRSGDGHLSVYGDS